jgi:hypothetical protein
MDADRKSICELTLTSDWLQSKVEDRLLTSAINLLVTFYDIQSTAHQTKHFELCTALILRVLDLEI